jgi:hypothetical protein
VSAFVSHLLDKGDRVFDVRHPDFAGGAQAGSDATLAIQAAIDHVATISGGGIAYIPAGVFLVSSTITLKPGVSIAGAGRSRTILDFQNGDLNGLRGEGTATSPIDDLEFSDFQIRGILRSTVNPTERHAFLLEGLVRRVKLRNIRVVDADDTGIRISYAGGTGLEPEDCELVGCEVFNVRNGSGFEIMRTHRTRMTCCYSDTVTDHGFRFAGGSGLNISLLTSKDADDYAFYFGGFGSTGTSTSHVLQDFVATGLVGSGFGIGGVCFLNGCKRGVVNGFAMDGQGATGTRGVLVHNADGIPLSSDANTPNEDVDAVNGIVRNCEVGIYINDEQYRTRIRNNRVVMGSASVRGIELRDQGRIVKHVAIERNTIISVTSGQMAIYHKDNNASTFVMRRWNTAIMNAPAADGRSGASGTLITNFNGVDTNESLAY